MRQKPQTHLSSTALCNTKDLTQHLTTETMGRDQNGLQLAKNLEWPIPKGEWARGDLNSGPPDYESGALTMLSYGPTEFWRGDLYASRLRPVPSGAALFPISASARQRPHIASDWPGSSRTLKGEVSKRFFSLFMRLKILHGGLSTFPDDAANHTDT